MHDLEQWIKKCEGLKTEPYMDTTGHLTIGWGRNLIDGISIDEAELMFKNDLEQAIHELYLCSWFASLPTEVRNALINMNFNLGISKFLGFKKMILALIEKDYINAAKEALNSRWAKQVPERAKDIALMISEGK